MTQKDSSGAPRDTRSSALWGTGNRGGESRSNALWSKGGRGLVLSIVAIFVLSVPLAVAGGGPSKKGKAAPAAGDSFIEPSLLALAETNPNQLVKVIIQSETGKGFGHARGAFKDAAGSDGGGDNEREKDRFRFVDSVAVTLKAKKIKLLARKDGLTVTPDARIRFAATPTSSQIWPTASNVRPFYKETVAGEMPTIAIVDSGVEKNRADFDMGARVVDEVVVTKLEPNSNGDGRGHGTFVAGIAAGSAPNYAGAAPGAKIVSIDVMDDSGMARTSDVIAAAEWIYQNRESKNIRVANFSLHSVTPSSFTWDPLDKAVEKLWFSGVVVVAAAGNYGLPTGPSGVKYAPGNDPFVITVGAIDLENSASAKKHDVPGWSAYGYTYDGFRKPEVGAAGRYMIGPIPVTSTLAADKAENLVAPGYIRLSGTSFSAPIVTGAAAQILARHPEWTPDQVKGALMLRARHVPEAPPGSAGVGEINAQRAATVVNPPNPNAGLNRFLVPDPTGGLTVVFDAASWQSVARADVSWDSVSWNDVSWNDASWQSVSWNDVSWDSVSWTDVSWTDGLAIGDVSWEDAASAEVAPVGGDYMMTPEEEALALLDPELAPTEPAPPAPESEPAPPEPVMDATAILP